MTKQTIASAVLEDTATATHARSVSLDNIKTRWTRHHANHVKMDQRIPIKTHKLLVRHALPAPPGHACLSHAVSLRIPSVPIVILAIPIRAQMSILAPHVLVAVYAVKVRRHSRVVPGLPTLGHVNHVILGSIKIQTRLKAQVARAVALVMRAST